MLRSGVSAVRRSALSRGTRDVLTEYGSGWSSYRETLASSDTLEQWLCIENLDEREDWFYVDGELTYRRFNSSNFYRQTLAQTLRSQLATAESITEYGCGIGRNLLYLKKLFPNLRCYGYELTPDGVDIARQAAAKFALDIEYAQLDYVFDPPEKFVFPVTDAAFTMFSLEQLPTGCDIALGNILSHVRYGSIHLEPIPEYYPKTLRGMIARLDHRKAGYLGGFPAAVERQNLKTVSRQRATSAHNPLMFPSVIVLHK